MEHLSEEELIEASIDYSVAQILKNEERKYPHLQFDPQFRKCLSYLITEHTKKIGVDLELFAKHGKRTIINAEDVKLLCRHNDTLREQLQDLGDSLISSSTTGKKKSLQKPNLKNTTE